MLRSMLSVATLCAAAPALAQGSKDCTRLPTQLDMNFCAREGWEISDRELNRLWGVVKPQADRAGQGQMLLDDQRGWLRFRDGTCAGERDAYAGGSIADMVYWTCMDRLTIARNRSFRDMMR